MTDRDQIALAMLPLVAEEHYGTVEDAAKELGIPAEHYDPRKHWPKLLVRRAYQYADAFLVEQNRQSNS